ncbi:MAG TPA: mannose-1-phosphate guanylyltransferase, partial [Candidatus Limiplasma sp.]|nr:mannose-1-phosphate guanylyltransferase [Candidatus Limiplasma sp.]
MKTVAVIMAGGRGERFWPYSRRKRPKQFLSLTPDGKPMIRLTFERITRLVPPEDVYVVTGEEFIALVQEHLPELPAQNILAEPCARNTAPCIGLAAAVARSRNREDVVLAVMPSDHLIREEAIFLNDLKTCVAVAEKSEAILTMGITPTYPETGYGYIHYGEPLEGGGRVYRVFAFKEKPPVETARRYMDEGCYLWNSGIFVFRADSMLAHMARLMPALHG